MTKEKKDRNDRNEKKAKETASVTKTESRELKPAPNPKKTNQKQTQKKENTLMKSAAPYITAIAGLLIAICFVTVHLFGYDDGAGVIGYAVQWVLAGLLGVGAVFLPLAMFFIGAKRVLFNIKWKFSDSEDKDMRREHGRIKMQSFMAILLIVIISVAFGVIHETYHISGFSDMWLESANYLEGGGIIGSSLAFLMVTAFERLITFIILWIFGALAVILMAGLTPDRIILRIQYNRAVKKEKAEEERILLQEQEKERLEEQKRHEKLVRLSEQQVKTESAETKAKEPKMSVDEILGVKIAEKEDISEEVYIGPSADYEESLKKSSVKTNAESAREGKDYAEDAPFDGSRYAPLSGVMENIKSGKAPIIDIESKNVGEISGEDIELGVISEDELHSDIALVTPDKQDIIEEEPETPYIFPPYDLLSENQNAASSDYSGELQENAKKLMETLKSFKVGIREITYSRGPTITRYELKPEVGIRVKSIANLVDDIALSLATSGVRIEAPIPNKPAVGIEVPNRTPATVYLRDLIESPRFTDAKSYLTACLGMDVGGNPIYFDISKMPHLLIAGATGMGKSVCINSIIISLLYKARPDQLKLILIDPKKVEFNIYKDIPHLYAPIVSDPKKAAGALASAVAEMERRFSLIEEVGVRDIATYNKVTEDDAAKEHLSHMVIIIDELADLMMTAADEVETSICRLAQKARAAGIHLIIGTQRPSVDVITGLIKSNIPSRIACTVASQIDSRTIIDMAGAEKLIGRGDMLFAPVGSAKPLRVQGAFVSESEVEQIVSYIKETNSTARYNNDFIQKIEEEAAKCGLGKKDLARLEAESRGSEEGGDEKFREAVLLAIEENKIATSLLQRRLGIGYGRAAKIIDSMEEKGYVSPPDGNKPRRVLISMDEYMRRIVEGGLEGE